MTFAATWNRPWRRCARPWSYPAAALSLTLDAIDIETERPVATPNYGYEKRQKELAKKKKKEEKLKAKAERKASVPGSVDEQANDNPPPAQPQR